MTAPYEPYAQPLAPVVHRAGDNIGTSTIDAMARTLQLAPGTHQLTVAAQVLNGLYRPMLLCRCWQAHNLVTVSPLKVIGQKAIVYWRWDHLARKWSQRERCAFSGWAIKLTGHVCLIFRLFCFCYFLKAILMVPFGFMWHCHIIFLRPPRLSAQWQQNYLSGVS